MRSGNDTLVIHHNLHSMHIMCEQEWNHGLQARRDMPVDVQVGPFLWEDAPQELRSRLWIALLGNPMLIGNLVEEKVCPPLTRLSMECTLKLLLGYSGSDDECNPIVGRTIQSTCSMSVARLHL